ncbi:MAG: hypothetical protein J6Q85_04825 [Clostridia bacterium]|nr:hypothetical protein [Clostridia bacterium]
MVSFFLRLAEKNIAVRVNFQSTLDFCREYLTDDTDPDAELEITLGDIASERIKAARERELEGLPPYDFSAQYLETLALYRKIASALIDFDTFLFHGSALSMDGRAYIFTAKSGTGKSTHAAIWRRVFGERVVMINDDKPLIKIKDGAAYVYGTPWCGKHGLGTNASAPLSSIAIIERAEHNSISPCPPSQAIVQLYNQAYRIPDKDKLSRTLAILDKLRSTVGVYVLKCNMDDTAAEVAYATMKGSPEVSSATMKGNPELTCATMKGSHEVASATMKGNGK